MASLDANVEFAKQLLREIRPARKSSPRTSGGFASLTPAVTKLASRGSPKAGKGSKRVATVSPKRVQFPPDHAQ